MKLLHTLYKLLHRVKWVHLQVKKCGPISCVFVTILLLVFSLITAAFIIWYHISQKNVLTLYIDCEGPPLSTVNEKFLSLGLDSSVITDGFKNFNMTNPKLIKMIKHLSPAYLRVGGNLADKLVFVDGNVTFYENKYFQYNETLNYPENYTLKASDWLKLNELVRNAQMDMIFDLNSLLRFKNGSWNYENGKRLIQYSHDHELMLHWELGNEPNSYPHKFDTSVNATQLGRDYGTLKELLNQYEMYKNSYLVGPSTTRLRNKEIAHYFGDFLKSGARAINAITWHQLTLRLSCAMNFMIYPHDTQECKLQMESLSHTTDDMIFQWDPEVPLVVDENIELPQLALVKNHTADCTQVYSTGNFTCLEVIFQLKRRLGYYLFHTYIPTCLIVIMSWVSFWIKPEAAPARVTLGVTSLLTLSTQHAKSQAALPPVSYLKAVDAFMSACTVFVFMALMEYCLVNIVLGDSDLPKPPQVQKQKSNSIYEMPAKPENSLLLATGPTPIPVVTPAQKARNRALNIDRFSRGFFPFLFTVLNLTYWIMFAEYI